MPEPRSLEECAERVMDVAEACLDKKGQAWACFANWEGQLEEPRDRIVQILRTYAEQEVAQATERIMKAERTIQAVLIDERNVLLAVVRGSVMSRAVGVLQCKICGHTWLSSNSPRHYGGCPVAHPDIQWLLKEMAKRAAGEP